MFVLVFYRGWSRGSPNLWAFNVGVSAGDIGTCVSVIFLSYILVTWTLSSSSLPGKT